MVFCSGARDTCLERLGRAASYVTAADAIYGDRHRHAARRDIALFIVLLDTCTFRLVSYRASGLPLSPLLCSRLPSARLNSNSPR